jgi:hypothetical protein
VISERKALRKVPVFSNVRAFSAYVILAQVRFLWLMKIAHATIV